ncbi:MAG: FoF1 ATP synthase subunit delta/epsilon [Phycisphaerales bacterium]
MAESKTFRCRVITPEARVLDAQVRHVQVPLWDGKAGFLRNATALVGKLGYGELSVELAAGETRRWFIEGGFMQNVANELTVLASGAIEADKLDRDEIRAELAEANAHTSANTAQMDKITDRRNMARAKLAMLS